jgi:hypothetical protein
MIWAGQVASIGESRCAHKVLVGRPDGKNPLGKRMRGWKNNIKMDFQEVGWGGMDWTDLAQDRDRWWALVSAEMNLRIP